MLSTAHIQLGTTMLISPYFAASLWPYCRWIHRAQSGLEMDLLCEHGDLNFSKPVSIG